MEKISAKLSQCRNGAVLTFSTILKRDHFPTPIHSTINVEGAPNFRSTLHNIYGTSQPTVPGLITILTLLKSDDNKIYWFNTREEPVIYIHGKPFVLRDADNPKKNIDNSGINADRLEQMETRLKLEILREVTCSGNLLLIHDELHDGRIIEQVVHVTENDVMTLKEVMEKVCSKDRVEYFRIPIAPNQRPEDLYLDTFTRAIFQTSAEDPLIFNCGVGSSRTTFGMVVALILRQCLIESKGNGFSGLNEKMKRSTSSLVQLQTSSRKGSKTNLESTSNSPNKTLDLLKIIESGITISSTFANVSAVQFASERSHLIPTLIKALNGEYTIISSLLSVLDYSLTKSVVDSAIDKCDTIVNLRHEILVCRVKYYTTADESYLVTSIGYLERYFFLLCFTSYIYSQNDNGSYKRKFSEWMSARHEVMNMLHRLRRTTNRLFLFRPIEDLSTLQTEIDQNVVKERVGTVLHSHVILKSDQWTTESKFSFEVMIDGAPNFRQVLHIPVFASAQPTVPALLQIIIYVKKKYRNIVWINLREEPLCYINGIPYVLRDRYIRLRNMKSYAGISGDRLDVLESRLKHDVEEESHAYNGTVLVHEEVQGNVKPTWVDMIDVKTLKEVFSSSDVTYRRVPVTSEAPFECTDFDDILALVLENIDSGFVLNCQMGVGRSSAASIIVYLIFHWLDPVKYSISSAKVKKTGEDTKPQTEVNYELIHSLVRSIKNGAITKKIVDSAIDSCDSHVNIRHCIERYRLEAENGKSKQEMIELMTKGLYALQRYFLLIAFEAYLESQNPSGSVKTTFAKWFAEHAEMVNMLRESNHSHLIPIGSGQSIQEVVQTRSGGVLAQNMILKFDHFPGCQKKGIPALITGAPNFRGVNVGESRVYGVAMPTKDAIRITADTLATDGAIKVIWTSLREEPVIFIRGRPYVLRNHDDPFKNLETTGIEKSRVERMEAEMKLDVINEIEKYNGKLMLHEEEAGSNGFRIVPIWETVSVDQVETPNEVFESMRLDGYDLEYLRVPVTDEQAPIPHVFDMLLGQVSKLSSNVFAVFNCQMGRGRTTTSMVIACITDMVSAFDSEATTSSGATGNDNALELMDEKSKYKKGNYKIIIQLMRVLSYGRFAKSLVDSAIDKCAHIQNIREAIYDYKLRCQDMTSHTGRLRTVSDASLWIDDFDSGETEPSESVMVAMNYLARYFYLIAFAGYMLERKVDDGKVNLAAFPPFSEWLNQRREISSIVDAHFDLC